MPEERIELATDIDAYIDMQPEAKRPFLNELRSIIRSAVPEATEKIAWGMPTFVLAGRNLVHFACFKQHAGFFPGSGDVVDLSRRFAGYQTGKGSVQLPFDRPIPVEAIHAVIGLRADENRTIAALKTKKTR